MNANGLHFLICNFNKPQHSMKKFVSICLCLSLAFSGCTTPTKDIASTPVSSSEYQGYQCSQLNQDASRVQSRMGELTAEIDQAASSDKVIMVIGLFLLWPMWLALGNKKHQETEYAQLKGQSEAIKLALVAKKC